MPGGSDDSRLVAAALAGDPQASQTLAARLLATIEREVGHLLRRRAVGRGDAREELRDLVQEVLLSLFERDARELRRWDPARGRSLDSFVRLVARRRAARLLARRGGSSAVATLLAAEGEAAEIEADDQLLADRLEGRSELGVVLDGLYAEMGPRDFELFDLLFLEEREPQEVAEALEMTRGAVNAWRYRMRKLARRLALSRLGDTVSPKRGESTRDETRAQPRDQTRPETKDQTRDD